MHACRQALKPALPADQEYTLTTQSYRLNSGATVCGRGDSEYREDRIYKIVHIIFY